MKKGTIVFTFSSILLFSITEIAYAQNKNNYSPGVRIDHGSAFENYGSIHNIHNDYHNTPPYLDFIENGVLNDRKAWDLAEIKSKSCYTEKNLQACDQLRLMIYKVKDLCNKSNRSNRSNKSNKKSKACTLLRRIKREDFFNQLGRELNNQNNRED